MSIFHRQQPRTFTEAQVRQIVRDVLREEGFTQRTACERMNDLSIARFVRSQIADTYREKAGEK